MKFVSMRSEPGQRPVIIADLLPGETVAEGASVENGSGIVQIASGSSVAIRCVEMFAGDESLGHSLARRARRGDLRVVVEKSGRYLAIDIDPPAVAVPKEA